MASNRIKGITIEIAGDTTKLSDSLSKVDKSLSATQSQLKDVNKLLKLDPGNVELLRQKQDLLNKSVADSKEKVKQLEAALDSMGGRTEANAAQYDAIQREIIACKQQQKQWNDELAAMEPKVKSLSDKFQDFSNKTGEMAQKTKGLSMAAGAAGAGMVAMAVSAGKTADDLLTMSRNTGFSVEELQKLKYAADLIDVSYEDMTGSITKLTKSMSSENKAFAELGVSIRNEDGTMRDAVDVWYDALEALGKVENETERDALAMQVFGKSAMEMSGIVDDGGAALKALGEEAEATGTILGRDAVEDAGKFNDGLDRLKATAQQSFLSAGAALADSLLPMLEKLVQAVSKVLTWFGNLDGTTQTIILVILGLVAALSPVLTLISTITAALPALSAAMTFLTGPVGLVIAAVTALVAIGVALYKNWDLIKEKATALWQSIKETFSKIKDAITKPIEAAKDFVKGVIDKIKSFFQFKVELPKIKLPHFAISPAGWKLGDLLKGIKPSLGIEWYAKAMKDGMILQSPTIFGARGNTLLAGGEAGDEAVVGVSSLRSMIQEAIAQQTAALSGIGGGDITIPVVIGGERLDTLIIKASQRANYRSGGR